MRAERDSRVGHSSLAAALQFALAVLAFLAVLQGTSPLGTSRLDIGNGGNISRALRTSDSEAFGSSTRQVLKLAEGRNDLGPSRWRGPTDGIAPWLPCVAFLAAIAGLVPSGSNALASSVLRPFNARAPPASA